MDINRNDIPQLQILWTKTLTVLFNLVERKNSGKSYQINELEKSLNDVFQYICKSIIDDSTNSIYHFENVIKLRIFENIFEWNYNYTLNDVDFKIVQLKLYEKILTLYPDFCFSEPKLVYPLIATIQHTSSFKNLKIEKQLLKTLQELISRVNTLEKLRDIGKIREHDIEIRRRSLLYRLAIKSKRRIENDDFDDEESNLSIMVPNEDRFDIMQLEVLSDISDDHDIPKDLYYDSVLDLIIQFISSNSELGWCSRDTILLFLSASNQSMDISKDISNHTDILTIILQFLGAAYKKIPKVPHRFLNKEGQELNWKDYIDWRDNMLEVDVKSLDNFFNIWTFIISILQVAHPIVKSKLLHLIHNHFLRVFLGSSITSISKAEKLSGIAYLEILLIQSASNEPLLHLILGFLTTERIDRNSEHLIDDNDNSLNTCTMMIDFEENRQSTDDPNNLRNSKEIGSDAWIKRLMNKLNTYLRNQKNTYLTSLIDELANVNSMIGLVTLSLFERIITFNSEDMMYILIFQYLSINFAPKVTNEKRLKFKSLLYTESQEYLQLIPLTSILRRPDSVQKRLIMNEVISSNIIDAYEWLSYQTTASISIQDSAKAISSWRFKYSYEEAPTKRQNFSIKTKNVHQASVKPNFVSNIISTCQGKIPLPKIVCNDQDVNSGHRKMTDYDDEDAESEVNSLDRFITYLERYDRIHYNQVDPLKGMLTRANFVDYVEFFDHYLNEMQQCLKVKRLSLSSIEEKNQHNLITSTSNSNIWRGLQLENETNLQNFSSQSSQVGDHTLSEHQEDCDTPTCPDTQNILEIEKPSTTMFRRNSGITFGVSDIVMKELRMSSINRKAMITNEKAKESFKDRILTMSEYEFMKCTGPFLSHILSGLTSMMKNCFEANLLITSIITRLAAFPCEILRNFLLLQLDKHEIQIDLQKDPLVNLINDQEQHVYLTYSHLLVKHRLFKMNNSIESFLMNYPNLKQHIAEPKSNRQTKSNQSAAQNSQPHGTMFKGSTNISHVSPLCNFINKTKEKLSRYKLEHATIASSTDEDSDEAEDLRKSFQLKDIMKHFFGANGTSLRRNPANIKRWLNWQLTSNDYNAVFFQDKILAVIVFEEFCKELAALCIEHANRL